MELTHQLSEANQKLERLTMLDGLTGVTNRRHFDKLMIKEWRRAQRNKFPISLIMIDIDYFKKYNDTYGHLKGDDCLKKVAKALISSARRSADFVSRYGGEEFAITLPALKNDATVTVAKRVRCEVERMKIYHEKSDINKYVTISLGVATIIPVMSMEHEVLIQAADRALYMAKNAGRNRVVATEYDYNASHNDYGNIDKC